MGLFTENTHYNPLCLDEKTGFEAAWEQAAFEDDTKALVEKSKAKKAADLDEDNHFVEIIKRGGRNA